MNFKINLFNNTYYFNIIILLCFSLQGYAQLCEGSLGDAVAEIDFGSGTGVGSALGSAITAFTYSNSGYLDEGEYTIASTTSGLKPGNSWHTTTDHTGNSNGYMMIINSDVLADEGVFYTKTVSGLCGYTTYEFSAWIMNIMNPSVGTDEHHPDVTFRISDTSGNVLGSYNTGDIPQTSTGVWVQYGFFFTLENDTEVVLRILNSAPSSHPGNDIALDDITFKPCGPTITNSIENETGTNLTICQNEVVNYNFQTSISAGYSDPQYQWQVSNDNGISWTDMVGETSENYNFTDSSTAGTFLYRVTVANGNNINTVSCRINSDEYTIEVIEAPDILTGESEQSFCTTQEPTISDIEVSSTAIWYDAETGGNILSDSVSLVDGTTYYAAQETNNGCESDDRLAVLISLYSPSLILNDISTIICDDLNDTSEIVDLTMYESEINDCTDCSFSYFTSQSDAENYSEEGLIISPTNFEWSIDTDTIYVRIDSSDNCYQIAEISITLQETPIIPISDFVGICEDETYVTVDAGFGFDSYLWSTGAESQSIDILKEDIGNYSVTVTQDYGSYACTSTKEFEIILSNAATISNIEVEDWTDTNNSITINITDTSFGDYEYSIDGITYQDSNVFTGLEYGEYIAYVRDKNGCGVTPETVYILNFPKYFTPNNDGVHDTWYIEHYETEPSMTIHIFDRFGKILTTLDATSSWDGTYNGITMPSTDYWFAVTRSNGNNYKGHFALKR